MTTTINANGSKWRGEAPDEIEALLERLTCNPLDPMFEEFGCFAFPTDDRAAMHFWGNFREISAVFDIVTDDPDLIERLTVAIRANMATKDYADGKRAYLEYEATRRRNRMERLAALQGGRRG